MDYKLWLAKIDKKCQGKYVSKACPLLIGGKCTIYESRPNCCRSFPKKGNYYCSDVECAIIKKKIRKNTKKSTEACLECKSLCCSAIMFPKNIKLTKAFFMKWMNADCDDCNEYFK